MRRVRDGRVHGDVPVQRRLRGGQAGGVGPRLLSAVSVAGHWPVRGGGAVRRVAIVVLIALASAGCEGNPSRTPSRPYASEPPRSGPAGTSSAPSPISTP